jgi:hypothetical protein
MKGSTNISIYLACKHFSFMDLATIKNIITFDDMKEKVINWDFVRVMNSIKVPLVKASPHVYLDRGRKLLAIQS